MSALLFQVPRESLLFIIPAFGGIVSWEGDGAPFGESDQTITHQIVDREAQGRMFLFREYVQPQWIFDCVNTKIILPTADYTVGRVPPPHLSPFVDNEEEGYVPDYTKTIKSFQAAFRKEVLPLPGVGQDSEDPQNLLVEGIIDRTVANEAAQRKQKMMIMEQQYHDELKKELKGDSYVSNIDEQSGEEVITNIEQSSSDMATVLMSKEKRKLYEAMEMSNVRKKEKTARIKERKKKLEEAQ